MGLTAGESVNMTTVLIFLSGEGAGREMGSTAGESVNMTTVYIGTDVPLSGRRVGRWVQLMESL